MTRRPPLPPYGREYLAQARHAASRQLPTHGPVVAFGPGAWAWARGRRNVAMVLPEDRQPWEYSWPVDGEPVLVHEIGCVDTVRMERLALVLLLAGAPMVYVIRHSQLPGDEPRRLGIPGPVFYREAPRHVA